VIAAAFSSASEPCAARQRPHGSLPAVDCPSNSSVFSHVPVSSVPNHIGTNDMDDTSGPNRRHFSAFTDPKHQTRTRLQESLTLHVTDPAKVVARKVAASPDTVDAHRASVPQSWAGLIAYCRAYPAFALDVLEEMGIDIDRDREAYAMFLLLQQRVRGQ
jgi:hypothetical protein